MKISYNWLKQYIHIDLPAEEVADILTNTGLEVEKTEIIETIKGGLNGLVVGHVLSKEKHPDADRLNLAKVDVGNGQILDIVCGAPNLETGQHVIVATIDTVLYAPDGESFTIKKSKIRGQVSEGMICSEKEIGVGNNSDGIIVLGNDIKPGTLAANYYGIENDVVFEIGLTPNRTDAMSHIGVARDIMAALNAQNEHKIQLHFPETTKPKEQANSSFTINVENTTACPRYSGILLKNIKVADSPNWLKNKLLAVGVPPINNVVDITNYVLKEMGQALHAFDADKITGNKIVVKTMPNGTKFTTLDKVERSLNEEDLMICNAEEGMCMAGVFGGLSSGVSNTTSSIFLESAYFDSTFIRKTSTRHNLRTDAAQRYEKGADPEITVPALFRAVALMQELCGAEVNSAVFDIYPEKLKEATVNLSLERLNNLAGITFPKPLVLNILKDLDFKIVKENAESLELGVPLYRADVTREADVIEELMRIYGLNNIPVPNEVHSTLSFQEDLDEHYLKEKLAHTLNGFGFNEIMTNSISQSKFYEAKKGIVQLQNSMTSELDCMRASLIPEGLISVRHNINRQQAQIKFFEFGNVYLKDYVQEQHVAIYLSGSFQNGNWASQKVISGLFQLKGIVQALFRSLKIENYSQAIINDREIYFDVKDKEIAKIWEITKERLADFDIEQPVFAARIKWENVLRLLNKQHIRFKELSKFPEVSRDLAAIVDENISFEVIDKTLRKHNSDYLKNIELFDIFRSEEKIGAGKKSYALNFKLQDTQKTLTDKEIDKTINKIIKTLEEQFAAVIRK